MAYANRGDVWDDKGDRDRAIADLPRQSASIRNTREHIMCAAWSGKRRATWTGRSATSTTRSASDRRHRLCQSWRRLGRRERKGPRDRGPDRSRASRPQLPRRGSGRQSRSERLGELRKPRGRDARAEAQDTIADLRKGLSLNPNQSRKQQFETALQELGAAP